MARVFITGSVDGLGRLSAEALLAAGHDVVAHARSTERAQDAADLRQRGAEIVVGDLADVEQVRGVAEQVGALGGLDAIIHNAGVYSGPSIMPVNIVAPYLLTELLPGAERQIYLSSGLHRSATTDLAGVGWGGGGRGTYGDSKLFVTALTLAVARLRPQVHSNAVNPGWVPTKMGGPGAPDDLGLGHVTQDWLATSDDPAVLTSGGYWHHQQRHEPDPVVAAVAFQDRLLAALAAHTGTALQ
ncbi:MAG: SDR family NAD(P)-dependent oxidoreductase [Solirubrobacteraceae bacterium]|nr:SDR family NAD(P)-dependent oxidoreductase [Solirubrobacteraceae bacterium]